jgi:hypothetical protein
MDFPAGTSISSFFKDDDRVLHQQLYGDIASLCSFLSHRLRVLAELPMRR